MSRRQMLLASMSVAIAPLALSGFRPPILPITKAVTNVAAIVGTHSLGQLNQAVLVKSFTDFTAIYGSQMQTGSQPGESLLYAVHQYFLNGGQSCYVVRVADSSPAAVVGSAVAKTGIYALTDLPFNLLVLPGIFDRTVWQKAEAFCVQKRAFLVLDAPGLHLKADQMEHLFNHDLAGRSDHAALYYPWLNVPDLLSPGKSVVIPPSSSVAGIIANNDSQRGVGKSPAGMSARLAGVESLSYSLSDAEDAILENLNINTLRSFPAEGSVVWGARTFQSPQSDSTYKYLSTRRLEMFIEQSLIQGLTWTQSEPNQPKIWALVASRVEAFLLQLFREGAFAGSTSRAAFYVKCDGATTTPADISQGNLNVEVGFAPLKPAEFIAIKITLNSAKR